MIQLYLILRVQKFQSAISANCCPLKRSLLLSKDRIRAISNHHSRQFSTHSGSTWSLEALNEISARRQSLIFHSRSNDTYTNLAIEHFLLTKSDHSSHILFFYTNRPCVVIGRNQNPWLECDLKRLQRGLLIDQRGHSHQANKSIPKDDDENVENEASTNHESIDLIRRRSGGGTVFHDLGNLNYSVIVPNDKEFQRRKHAQMVVDALNGMDGHDFGEVKVNDRNDIVLKRDNQWLKISGSAFKLTKGRALHHGTLLYSSPNLRRISDLLRSPGLNLITAKGVESVRSKVGNLKWENDIKKRKELQSDIVQAISEEFWKLYGEGQDRNADIEKSVGDEDTSEKINPITSKGVQELRTNDWRFGQTPRFDFKSGCFDDWELQFHVNRGTLERVHFSNHKESKEIDINIKIHDIEDWNKFLNEKRTQAFPNVGNKGPASKIDLPKALIQQVESIFPSFRT